MRIWKYVGTDWHGYGNGFKAVIYEYPFTDHVEVRILRNDHELKKHICPNVNSAKRWAERNYLKAKNY